MNCKIVLPLILLLLAPFVNYELIKYNEYNFQCEELQDANIELLQSKHCRHIDKRIKHKNAGTVDCEKAEMDLKRSIRECTFIKWWNDFELVQLYNRVLGSYWRIVGVILPLSIMGMYLVYKYISNRNSELLMYDRMDKLADKLGYSNVHKSPLQSISYRKNKAEIYDSSPLMEID